MGNIKIVVTAWVNAEQWGSVDIRKREGDLALVTIEITQKCHKNFDEFETIEEARECFEYLIDREKRNDNIYRYQYIALYCEGRRIDFWRRF